MYQAYWGLRESPFRGGVDPRFFYQGPIQDEALARLHFLVDQRRRLGLLLGESGLGKSLILDVFGREQRTRGAQVASVSLIGLGSSELLWQLTTQWGMNPDDSWTVRHLWRAVTDRLVEHRYQQLTTVLLLDDADEAGSEALEQILRLAQWDLAAEARFTMVLSANTRRISCLGMRLLEIAELRTDLEPWDETDTAQYIQSALRRAGRSRPAFTPAALARLHQLCDGIPRRVQQLADLSLAAGAGQELPQIEAATVEAACHELGVVTLVQ